ncbi:MAG: nucleotide sugar dehydrogenase, partial [Acidimicrobiia bacterium]
MQFERDVVVVGGCGRVGLPLAIALAGVGLRVVAYDRNPAAVDAVGARKLPFDEPGAQDHLETMLDAGRLEASTAPECVSTAEHVIVVVGTPIDEH